MFRMRLEMMMIYIIFSESGLKKKRNVIKSLSFKNKKTLRKYRCILKSDLVINWFTFIHSFFPIKFTWYCCVSRSSLPAAMEPCFWFLRRKRGFLLFWWFHFDLSFVGTILQCMLLSGMDGALGSWRMTARQLHYRLWSSVFFERFSDQFSSFRENGFLMAYYHFQNCLLCPSLKLSNFLSQSWFDASSLSLCHQTHSCNNFLRAFSFEAGLFSNLTRVVITNSSFWQYLFFFSYSSLLLHHPSSRTNHLATRTVE